MNCPFCSALNRPKANFCSSCGSPLDLQACPKCEAINRCSAPVCIGCGCVFSSAAEPPTAAKAKRRIGPTPRIEPTLRFVEQTSTLATQPHNLNAMLAGLEEEVQRQLSGEHFDAMPGAARPAPPSAASMGAESPDLGGMTTPENFHSD
jgi:hypothetical protein